MLSHPLVFRTVASPRGQGWQTPRPRKPGRLPRALKSELKNVVCLFFLPSYSPVLTLLIPFGCPTFPQAKMNIKGPGHVRLFGRFQKAYQNISEGLPVMMVAAASTGLPRVQFTSSSVRPGARKHGFFAQPEPSSPCYPLCPLRSGTPYALLTLTTVSIHLC